jgi:hypothetical protein
MLHRCLIYGGEDRRKLGIMIKADCVQMRLLAIENPFFSLENVFFRLFSTGIPAEHGGYNQALDVVTYQASFPCQYDSLILVPRDAFFARKYL